MLRKILSIILATASIFSVCGCSNNADGEIPTPNPTAQAAIEQTSAPGFTKNIKVHFINVGQGDCEFIELPNNKTMLIDAGNKGDGDDIIGYIKSRGYDTLDYVIATHPHADHIGGMAEVLSAFNIGDMYMPNKAHTTKTFEYMIEVIENKKITLHTAKAGINILSDRNLSAELIAPVSAYYDDLNNYSAVVKIVYGDSVFLFTGDAETDSEQEMLSGNAVLDADVLKVGHHGSSTSSCDEFIQEVSPQIAVISCGKNNKYGHPHSETLQVLGKYGAKIYRTDTDGTVTVTADNKDNYKIEKEK